MRFHHSTRRGRNPRHGPNNRGGGGAGLGQPHSLSSRWAQLTYCRQTNIHFNRRLPVEPPASLQKPPDGHSRQQSRQASLDNFNYNKQEDYLLIGDNCQLQAPPAPTTSVQPIDDQLNRLNLNNNNNNNNNDDDHSPQRKSVNKMTSLASMRATKQRKLPPSEQRQTRSNSQKSTSSNSHESNESNTPDNTPGGQDKQWRLDMELVREKLVAQVEKHPFWSNKAAKRMRLVNLNERRVYMYELVSYCERRELEWRYEPYRGGLVAGSASFKRQQVAGDSGGQLAPPTGELQGRLSVSQPTSPSSDPARQQLIELGSSMLQNNQTTLQVPAPTPPQAQQQFEFDSNTTTTTTTTPIRQNNNLRSPIRRSCSSAASSPPRTTTSTPLSYQHAPIQHQNSNGSLLTVNTTATTTTTTTAQEPRPMPSAEFVWALEAPSHLQPAPFAGYVHTVELPGSSFVKRCHGCQGRGRLKCTSCHGVGYEVCISCSGKGTMKSLSRQYGSSLGASSRHSTGGARSSDYYEHSSGSSREQYGGMWGDSPSASSESRRHHTDGEPGGITQSGGSGATWISESCHFCHGAGQKRCWICAGRAYNCCLACAGTGQLRCYLNLNISWLNHKDECIANNSDAIIPKERLKLSSGLLLVDEVADQLEPVSLSPLASHQLRSARLLLPRPPKEGDTSDEYKPSQPPTPSKLARHQKGRQSQLINEQEAGQLRLISSRMLEKHLTAFKLERLIKQRQRVTQVDCFIVNWEWKRRKGHFVIYGDEQKVYIAKYPFKSICNIT